MIAPTKNRPLTSAEFALAQWMLEHGAPEARAFLSQLKLAEVTPERCPCGCASINFQIKGHAQARPGVHILGDYVFGEADETGGGAFIFSSSGILSGVEVYSYGDPVRVLPTVDMLRAFPV